MSKNSDEPSNEQRITDFNSSYEGLKTKILPETRRNISNMRLTLDYKEDYWLLESVRRMVGSLASRENVDQLFLSNPDLYKINWFRNDEWKQGQKNNLFKQKD